MIFLAKIYWSLLRAKRRFAMILLKPLFRSSGNNFKFDPYGTYSYQTISVGDDVYIGPGAYFLASESSIEIGNKVMFGPNVTIVAGDHNSTQIGAYMFDVKEKLPENDLPVIIQSDVWVGTGVIIMKGVTIGTGSIVAASALVTKDVPPFTIVAGVPARVIKKRFTDDELFEHERILTEKCRLNVTK